MLQVGQLVEKHISEAQENGEFDNLPGSGKRLKLNDDSLVPEALRVVCRFMKNAGFLPPELDLRREAFALHELMAHIASQDEQDAGYSLLNIRLQQARQSKDFLQGRYAPLLYQHLSGDD
ncbi:DUF1992 domain-containing protein [Erwinia tracheiphila]|uniref:DUF1992 domain-containing protein n=1 Tax=Erwinia tracheiphila TaxID=65700 RepID=A0A345CXC8_9GAMM|nr:DnaJ family domain-containing protein [Erwinia tracheiphila]AXF78095.1 DUF1992 domain-containing protein [Erwinia tracheiphila]UIA83191.1 DUF1992 domain-containing protein [Erwinia tracheiphila]UIA91770.1 DUF1992 domain-containing protein [Erwinia tracheiphila]